MKFDAGISDHYPVVFEPVISYDQPILYITLVPFMLILLLNFVSLIPSFFLIIMPLCHLVWILNNWLKFSTLPVVLL